MAPLRVQNWPSLDDRAPAAAGGPSRLDIAIAQDSIEEITVFAERLKRSDQEPSQVASPILLGPMTLTATTSDQANFTGLKVTAALPIGGLPGLDAVVNLSGGYDQVNASTTTGSEAATAGLRLQF